MQLIRKDMKKLQVWRHQATDTYLGMEEGNWVKHRVLYGRVLPAESRLAHQLYGSRVEKMIEIFLGNGDLEEGEGVSLSPDTMQPSYLIVSCRQYDGHRRAWGESL